MTVKPGQSLCLDWGYHSNAFYFVCTDIRSNMKPHLPRQHTRVDDDSQILTSALSSSHHTNHSISINHCDTHSHSNRPTVVTVDTFKSRNIEAHHGKDLTVHSLQSSLCDNSIEVTAQGSIGVLGGLTGLRSGDGALAVVTMSGLEKPMFRLDCQDIWHLNDIDSNSAFCKAIENCVTQLDVSAGWTMLSISKGLCGLFFKCC